MASLWQKQIKEQFLHSLCFLCGLCPFIPQVAMHLFLKYNLLKKPKDTKQDNSINKQWPCNYNSKFLAASKWRPCAFWAASHPNDYSIYWTTGRQWLPLQFKWCHKPSSLICYYCNNNSNNESSPRNSDNDSSLRNSNCTYKSKTTQAWWMNFCILPKQVPTMQQ